MRVACGELGLSGLWLWRAARRCPRSAGRQSAAKRSPAAPPTSPMTRISTGALAYYLAVLPQTARQRRAQGGGRRQAPRDQGRASGSRRRWQGHRGARQSGAGGGVRRSSSQGEVMRRPACGQGRVRPQTSSQGLSGGPAGERGACAQMRIQQVCALAGGAASPQGRAPQRVGRRQACEQPARVARNSRRSWGSGRRRSCVCARARARRAIVLGPTRLESSRRAGGGSQPFEGRARAR